MADPSTPTSPEPIPKRASRAKHSCWAILSLGLICPALLEATQLSLHAVIDPLYGATSEVLAEDGIIWAWGSNRGAAFGDGTTNSTVTARQIPLPAGVSKWTQLALGGSFAALDETGRLHGWGRPESKSLATGMSLETTPTLLDAGPWQTIAVTTRRHESEVLPWALGVRAGQLQWIRIALPTQPNQGALANRTFAPVTGTPAGLVFAEVQAGADFFLARTDSGRVFAAGVGASGCLGPLGNLLTRTFSDVFVEVSPPGPGRVWSRLAASDAQAFAWTDQDELYVWGRRFSRPDSDWIVDPTPRLVPHPSANVRWSNVGGANSAEPATVLIDTAGKLWEAGRLGINWLEGNLETSDLLSERAVVPIPAAWTPVQSFAKSPTHLLVLGGDGLIHAMGNNEDFQLGGIPPGEAYLQLPIVPGGEAPFLNGSRADLPEVGLAVVTDVLREPTGATPDDGQAAQLNLTRDGRSDLSFSVNLAVRARRADGTELPPQEATALAARVLLIPNPILQVASNESAIPFSVAPRLALYHDEDLQLEVEVLPRPYYYVGENSRVTLHYRFSTPVNYPPLVNVLWPIPGVEVFAGDYVDVIAEITDPDGYPTRAQLTVRGAVGNPAIAPLLLEPRVAGTKQLIRLQFRRQPAALFSPIDLELRVLDDQGWTTRVDLKGIRISNHASAALTLQVGGHPLTLAANANAGSLLLESSTDLAHWTVLETYDLPSPGLPTVPVVPANAEGETRFYRLRDPN